MLHYLYIYYYILSTLLLTLFFRTQYFLGVVILFEGLLATMFMLILLLGLFYNVFYIPAVGLLLLMFGGLELAIALLLFNLNASI